jgi:hypothetical protein
MNKINLISDIGSRQGAVHEEGSRDLNSLPHAEENLGYQKLVERKKKLPIDFRGRRTYCHFDF